MQDYHTNLNADDLRRINMLPPYISMALPFLHNRVEVEAHRLLNKYTRGTLEVTTPSIPLSYETILINPHIIISLVTIVTTVNFSPRDGR